MSTLQEAHPILMVPHVITFGVVIYTNGGLQPLDVEAIRRSIVAQLPQGSGVGQVTYTHHGPHVADQV